MRIGIPTLGDSGLEERVSDHFGRAPTFTVVDTESGEVEVLPNTSEHGGGSGKPPTLMRENDVEAMLCSNLGPRAINMFEELGIEVFIGAEGTVEETLKKWENNQLEEATDEEACEEHRH